MTKFIPQKIGRSFQGIRKIYQFPNGYGASVVCNEFNYGGDEGLWELGVLKKGHLCYSTPLTSDVIGSLTDEEVDDLLIKISELPGKNRELRPTYPYIRNKKKRY